MNIRLIAGILTACGFLAASSPLFAQAALMSPAEKRVYHACLYADWIGGYCRFHTWGNYPGTFTDCVIANRGCQCAIMSGGYWGPPVDDACRVLYRRRRR